jgi:osmotically-inducible protein OsmY
MKYLFRVVLMIAIVALGAYLLGFWTLNDVAWGRWRSTAAPSVSVDTGAVRQRLDKLDERAGRAVEKVDDYLGDAGLSGKIKSKMTLDDLVRARTIDVSTTGGVVTLEGTVHSVEERDQALRLARNTTGVTQVIDHLIVRR